MEYVRTLNPEVMQDSSKLTEIGGTCRNAGLKPETARKALEFVGSATYKCYLTTAASKMLAEVVGIVADATPTTRFDHQDFSG